MLLSYAEVFTAFQGGESCTETAARAGVTRQRIMQVVHQEARRRGEAVRSVRARQGPKPLVIPADLIDDYRTGRITHAGLVRVLGSCGETVRRALRRQGISSSNRTVASRGHRIYEEYKKGVLTHAQLATLFYTSVGYVSGAIARFRRSDPSPYYRRQPETSLQANCPDSAFLLYGVGPAA